MNDNVSFVINLDFPDDSRDVLADDMGTMESIQPTSIFLFQVLK